MSIQEGIHKYGDNSNECAMKEIRNLTSNEYFAETNYKLLMQEMKDHVLPILIFLITKQNRLLKSTGVANVSLQWVYTDKNILHHQHQIFML